MQLGSCIAVAVVQAISCISDWVPSLGTSICRGCDPKKQKKKSTILRRSPSASPSYDGTNDVQYPWQGVLGGGNAKARRQGQAGESSVVWEQKEASAAGPG